MLNTNLLDIIQTLASVATAFGIIIAFWEVRQNQKLASTRFEDEMTREYREIIRNIPVKALLGEELTEEEYQNNLDDFYQYIDLTNGQVYLRQTGRIGDETWKNWKEGIKSNLSLSSFKKAWEYIKSPKTRQFP